MTTDSPWKKVGEQPHLRLECPSPEVGLDQKKGEYAGAMETLRLFPIRMYLAAKALRDREEGQTMVEYALILALVSVAAVTILSTLGTSVSSIFNKVNTDL